MKSDGGSGRKNSARNIIEKGVKTAVMVDAGQLLLTLQVDRT